MHYSFDCTAVTWMSWTAKFIAEQLFYHGPMGHWQWPMTHVTHPKWWPILLMIHDPLTLFYLWTANDIMCSFERYFVLKVKLSKR